MFEPRVVIGGGSFRSKGLLGIAGSFSQVGHSVKQHGTSRAGQVRLRSQALHKYHQPVLQEEHKYQIGQCMKQDEQRQVTGALVEPAVEQRRG